MKYLIDGEELEEFIGEEFIVAVIACNVGDKLIKVFGP